MLTFSIDNSSTTTLIFSIIFLSLTSIFYCIITVYIITLTLGCIKGFLRKRHLKMDQFTYDQSLDTLPEITFIMPVHNETDFAVLAIKNVLQADYQKKQLIVVNDGSMPETLKRLVEEFDFIPIPKFFEDDIKTQRINQVYRSKKHHEVCLIDKENGDKWDANNAGLNACSTPYFVVIDADTTILEVKHFSTILRPVYSDKNVVAIGASLRVRNESKIIDEVIQESIPPKKYIPGMQTLEYLRTFVSRLGWDWYGGSIVVSGAFGLFKTDIVKQIRGYGNTKAEDMEITLRLHRLMKASKTPYKIFYLADPIAYTEVPNTFKTFFNQRKRWLMGICEVLWFHKTMLYNFRYGAYSWINYPFLIVAEALEPLLETIAYTSVLIAALLGVLNIHYGFLLLAIVAVAMFLYSLIAILLEEYNFKKYSSLKSFFRLVIYALIEVLGFRQLIVISGVAGFFAFLRNFKNVKEKKRQMDEKIKEFFSKLPK